MVRVRPDKALRGRFGLSKEKKANSNPLKSSRANLGPGNNTRSPARKRWDLPIPEFDEPPGGLIPIGDTGLYRTPSEPADPEDCERYPNSIFCGGLPIDLKLIDLGVSIVKDDCNIGIQAEPVLGFIKLPPVAIVYRKPECRTVRPLLNIVNEDKLDLPNNFEGKFAFITIPKRLYFKIPRLNQNEEIVYAEGIQECELLNININARNGEWISLTVKWSIVGNYSKTFFGNRYEQVRAEQTNLLSSTIDNYKNAATISKQLKAYDTYYTEALEGIDTGYAEKIDFLDYSGRGVAQVAQHYVLDPNKDYYRNDRYSLEFSSLYSEGGIAINPRGLLNESNHQAIINRYSKKSITREISLDTAYSDTGEPIYYDFGSSYYSYQVRPPVIATEIYEQEWQVILAPYSDVLPPPPPKEPCCMACCPPPDNALLKLLLKKVDKLSEIIGVDEYPASLPASLISKDKGFLGNLIPNQKASIPSLTKFLAWYVERFDEIMGQFEIPIQVKDSDPTTPGDQPIGFKLPNVAESIAEIMGLLLQTTINSETLINLATRALIEAGQDKQQNYKSYILTQAIVEYMGFELEEKKHKLPLTFKPGSESIEDLVKETEIDVSVMEYADKTDLRDNLTDLLQAAAIIRSVHWRKLDAKGDMKQQIMDVIKAFSKNSKSLSNRDTDGEGKDDFDRFLEDVEVGFTNHTGITDPLNPYGGSYSERPKIREIGNERDG